MRAAASVGSRKRAFGIHLIVDNYAAHKHPNARA